MEKNVNLVPFLRKGLSQYIKDGQTTQGSRAVIDFTVEVEGTKAKNAPSGLPSGFSAVKSLSLVGPADVKQVNPGIISHFYPPAVNTQRFNPTTMPFMEFYEADFPWRYTPLPAVGNQCASWLVLVAVNEEEYTIVTKEGKKHVEFNLSADRYNKVFPSVELHSKLAHVQLEEGDDEEGIARLLCASDLERGKHVTVFLLPAFETGRRGGLNEDSEGVDIGKRSWEDGATKFPIYYHWSFYADDQSGTFEMLANKLDMAPKKAYETMEANLTVDIVESGLKDDGLQNWRDAHKEYVIDVPVALNLAMGEKKDAALREEPQTLPQHYKNKLKEELLLNPVFVENTKGRLPQDEDPWVVPPVYGARHMLSENLDGDGVVPEVNLTLRHRIAAGMGASVVKENQEAFVHRAWQKVEKINELNQKLREYYQMHEVELKAEERLSKEAKRLRDYVGKHKLPRSRFKLITSDALPRVLSTSKLARRNNISLEQVRSTVSNGLQSVGATQRIIGITPEELTQLFDYETWYDIIDSEAFNELIANEMMQPYLTQFNWLHYLMMPLFNKTTKTIDAVTPKQYNPLLNPFLISPECSELSDWILGCVPGDTHTLNYYYDALEKGLICAVTGFQRTNVFNSADYIAADNSTIDKAVYPVTLNVSLDGKAYHGYIMDAGLYRNFCSNNSKYGFTEKDGKAKPYLAFEYHDTSGGSVKKETKYVFLFPSDTEGLVFKKIFFSKKNKNTLIGESEYEFKYEDGKCKPVSTHSSPYGQFVTYKPDCFTNSYNFQAAIEKLADTPEKKFAYHSPGKVFVDVDYKDAKKNSKIWRFVVEADPEWGVSLDGTKPNVNKTIFKKQLACFKEMSPFLEEYWPKTPHEARIVLNSLRMENVVSPSAFGLDLNLSEKEQLYNAIADQLDPKNHRFNNYVEKVEIKKEKEEPPISIPDLEKEKQDTVKALVKKYGYTEQAQLDRVMNQIRKGKLSKYPVMIYPEYLDPTFFYLRELSQDYVAPCSGALANNSVTVLQSNPVFEEAFLMGMNTEMGQELLWREYPTDQRGSYFRKFWATSQLPVKEKLNVEYYDIKEIPDWNNPLGQNHVRSDAPMLVFAIKGELMQAYPHTNVCLTGYSGKTLYIMAQASMASWLNEDTYLVGFEGLTVGQVNGLYLTFQEEVTSLEFEKNSKFDEKVAGSDDSAALASELINDPSVFLLPINNN